MGPQAQEVIVTFLDEIELRGSARACVRAWLAARFGEVPDDAKARIDTASDAALAEWTVRVLTAPTLAEVLATHIASPKPRRPAPPRKRTRRT